MNEDSVLLGIDITTQCNQLLEALNAENEILRSKRQIYDHFINDHNLEGESVIGMKLYTNALSQCADMLIMANESDMSDLRDLMSITEGTTLIGNEILTQINYVTGREHDSNQLADCFSNKAIRTSNPIESARYRNLSSIQRDITEQWRIVKSAWLDKEELYDQIDTSTINMFRAGQELRYNASQQMTRLMGVNPSNIDLIEVDIENTIVLPSHPPYIPPYIPPFVSPRVPSGTPPLRAHRLSEPQYASLAARFGFTQEEMDFLREYYPNLLPYLYAAANSPEFRIYMTIILSDIQNTLNSFHRGDLYYQDVVFTNEQLQILKDLEQGPWGLGQYGVTDADGNLTAIFPFYVPADNEPGITFGYGHFVSESEYNTDPNERALVETYCGDDPTFGTNMSGRVEPSEPVPISVCDELFEQDFRYNLGFIMTFLNDEGIELNSDQILALVIHRFKAGELGQTMCDLLRDYRDGTLDRDAMYNAWADDPGQSARRDACQDLFF